MVLEEQHQVPQHVVKSQYPPIGHTCYIAVKYQHQVISRLSLRECQKLPTVHSTDGAQFPAECANCLYTLVWGAIIGLISALSHTAWLDNVHCPSPLQKLRFPIFCLIQFWYDPIGQEQQVTLRSGDTVTNDRIERCCYCQLKTIPNTPPLLA